MINYNGKLIDSSTAVLGSNNRAFKYGDGLFETIKVQNLKVVFLEDHYFRLMASMRMLRMEISMGLTMEFMEKELLKTVQANKLENARLRLTVYRKDGGLYAPQNNKVDYLIEASPLNIQYKERYVVDLFKDYYLNSGLLSTLKTTNKLTNVLAGIYASENNLENCLLLNEKKQVVEAINGNVFIVKGNTIKTPPLAAGCVKGIIRKKIIDIISNKETYKIEEEVFSPFEIQKADEVFITNTIVGIQSVSNYKKAVFKTTVAQELSEVLVTLI